MEMLEAHQANSKLGKELDTAKAANEKLREDAKKLSLELQESKRCQVETLESCTRCKGNLQVANVKLRFSLEDARVAFQKGSEEF